MWAETAAIRAGRTERLIHDLLDGPRTAATLRAAAQATVNLDGRARRRLVADGANIAVAEHVAGTDNHGRRGLVARGIQSIAGIVAMRKSKKPCLYVI